MFGFTIKRALAQAAVVVLLAAAFGAVAATTRVEDAKADSVGICMDFNGCPEWIYSATQIFYGPLWTQYRGAYIVKAYDVWDRASLRYSGREDCWYRMIGTSQYAHLSSVGCWWE
jgi:hypothetical protein